MCYFVLLVMNLRGPEHFINIKRMRDIYFAGSHLQRTGDTIAPSFLSSAKALSTSFLSIPEAVATSPAETGFPASVIVLMTISFVVIIEAIS